MYMRLTRVQSSPTQLARIITNFRESVMPTAKQAMGYAGASLYLNRETGQTAGATFWESARALTASEPMGIAARTKIAQSIGVTILDIQRFQIVLLDRAQAATMTAFTRVDNGFTPPERLDAFANFIRDDVTAALRHRHGYQWMTISVDRTSGVVAVTSNWDTTEDREAAAPSFAPVLLRADEFGVTPIRIDWYEHLVLALLDPPSR